MKKLLFAAALLFAGSADAATQISISQIANFDTHVNALITAALPAPGVPTSRQIVAGNGLTGGGDLTADRTLALPSVGTAGTYGDATHVPVATVDAYGRVTGVTATAITYPAAPDLSPYALAARSIGTSARLTGGGNLTADRTLDLATVITAGSSGDATHVPAITYDAYGRVTAVTSTAITFPTQTSVTGNAGTATTLATARTIDTMTGDVTGAGCSFNGSANCTQATTLATTQTAVHTWSALQTFSAGLTGTSGTFSASVTASSIQTTSIGVMGNFESVVASPVSGYYKAGFRNDGANVYLMQSANQTTQAAALTASFNGYRPFSWSLSTGAVTIDGSAAGTSFGGSINVVGNISGNGALAFNSSGYAIGVQDYTADADVGVVPGSYLETVRLTGTITANRSVFLPATAGQGVHVRIVRTGGGAFTWGVNGKSLAVGQWIDEAWDTTTAAWVETAFGSL